MKTHWQKANETIGTAVRTHSIVALKGECEAEGLSRADLAREALLAARNGLKYLVKIGGCEAKGDMRYLMEIGVDAVVGPMIESGFAMKKYMEMLPEDAFAHRGVTIETATAVANCDELLEAGHLLTEATVGRSDLTASYGGTDVESDRTREMVKSVARKAKAKGLVVTMGGSISRRTLETLNKDSELLQLLDFIETRKVVVPAKHLLDSGALEAVVAIEAAMLDLRLAVADRLESEARQRKDTLTKRL